MTDDDTPTVKNDLNKIESALKSIRRFAFEHRRGGTMEKYTEALDAMEALERVKERVKDGQKRQDHRDQ